MGFQIIAVKSGQPQAVKFDELAMHLHEYNFIWIDSKEASSEELAKISKLFGFHYLSVENSLSKSQHSKIDLFDKYIFLTVFEVSFEYEKIFAKKISVFFGANFVVTTHVEDLGVLQKISEMYKNDAQLFNKGTAFFVYSVLDELFESYFPVLDSIADSIEKLETEVFSHTKKTTLAKLFKLKRKIVNLRRIINSQRDSLANLTHRENSFIPADYFIYFNDIYTNVLRLSYRVDVYRELISDILEAHLTIVSNNLNEIMKVLTIIATVMLPLTLVTGFYGMNVEFLEYSIFGQAGTYYFAIALMFFIGIAMFLWFKKMRWL